MDGPIERKRGEGETGEGEGACLQVHLSEDGKFVCYLVTPEGVIVKLTREVVQLVVAALKGLDQTFKWRLPNKDEKEPAPVIIPFREEVRVLMTKWILSLCARQAFLSSLTDYDRKGVGQASIGDTVAEHELTHHGETPHTLRHWVRGGNVRLVRDHKSVNYNDQGALQWKELFEAIAGLPATSNPPFALGTFGVGLSGGLKVNHTDLHCLQVPSAFPDFYSQLLCEWQFPELIKATPGYLGIKAEVTERWRKLGGGSAGVIMWVRNVDGLNRPVDDYEKQGCLVAAKSLASELGAKTVILLGDSGGSTWATNNSLRGVVSMLGEHMASNDGRRSQLQQLQYITALVEVTKVQLVVGERTGSVDKISLCGGIPCCQFIGKGVRQGNERLSDVYASGCGMGCNVSLLDCKNATGATELIYAHGMLAFKQWALLKIELEGWVYPLPLL